MAHKHDLKGRFIRALHLHEAPAGVRRVIIAVIGGTILLLGLALLVLPGPAVLVIPLGLAILATEFVWARRWLKKARRMFRQTKAKISGTKAAR